jgi:hypothetical protein
MRTTIPAVAALAAVLLAGCGTSSPPPTGPGAAGSSSPVTAQPSPPPVDEPLMSLSCSVPGSGAERDTGPLRPGVSVSGARVCKQRNQERPHRGLWLQTVTYDVVGGLAQLVRSYQQPDGPVGNGVCSAVGYVPLLVTFHTRQGELEAREPTGTCGVPQPAAVQAYQALELREVRADWTRQLSTQRSLDSGCAEQWKDMLWVERGRGPATAAPRRPGDQVRLCEYRDSAPSASGGDPHLTAAATVTPADAGNLTSHLRPGPPSCRAPGSTYAVLGELQGDVVYVAVDGPCRGRALWDSGAGALDATGMRLFDHLLAGAQ